MRFPFQPFSLLQLATITLVLSLGVLSPLLEAAGIMGIDFGTDWYKVALVKPGVPLEIVLNKDSNRKTDAHVTIRAGIRYFGSDAVNLVGSRKWRECEYYHPSRSHSIFARILLTVLTTSPGIGLESSTGQLWKAQKPAGPIL